MKRRFSKVLSVILCLFLMTATVSIAFAADGAPQNADVVISDAEGLAALSADPAAYAGKYIVLDQDIDVNDMDDSFETIGTEAAPFSGTFDGQGHVISNVEPYAEEGYVGLFGYVKDAVITNFTITGAIYDQADYEYEAFDYIGAVVGYADNSVISKITTEESGIEAGAKAGGIAGAIVNGSVVEDCVNGCTVTLNGGNNGGGIVGEAVDSDILRCINTADVNGGSYKNAAGIAGVVSGGKVSHCLNSGAVSSEIIQQSAGTSSGVAGIAGSVSDSTIEFCGNAGSVTNYTDCSGVAAAVSGNVTVSYCYNAVSPMCGGNYKTSSYTIAPAAAAIDHCVGVDDTVTSEAMKSAAAYEGWDFDTVWYTPGNYHGYAYPVLRDCSFHAIERTVTDPTCTSDGIIVYTCTKNCGFSYTEEGEKKLGHDYSILVSEKAANCTYEGEKTYKCSRCQQENPEKEIIPADPDKHVDADQDNVCDICEKTIKEEEVKKSFFQKVIDFFKRIFDWIKRLFTGKL